jgi:hypothetical protein
MPRAVEKIENPLLTDSISQIQNSSAQIEPKPELANKESNNDSEVQLKDAPKGKEFLLYGEQKLKSIRELKNALITMDNEVYYHHVTPERNDFATWIRDVFNEYELAHKVRATKSKEELEQIL